MDIYANAFVGPSLRIGSKGNQLKLSVDDKWYKGDYLGYEGASEYLASEILKQSNISDFVPYELIQFTFQDKPFMGCVSPAIQNAHPKAEIITLDNFFLRTTGKTIEKQTEGKGISEKIEYIVNNVEKLTGIKNFGQHLSTLFEFDAFILNEDRHYNNIAILEEDDGTRYSLCPIFDNGAGFLSDTRNDYPLSEPVPKIILKVKAKPITKDFVKQVEAVESLYGSYLKLYPLNLTEAFENIEKYYGENIRTRMETIVRIQERKWDRFIITEEKQED